MLGKLFGSKNDRELKRMRKIVLKIGQLESSMEQLSDEALKTQRGVFEKRLADGESLEDILPAAFAPVREAGKRARD